MAVQHESFVKLATRLINANGRPVTLRKVITSVDSAEPWKPASITAADTTITAAFFSNNQGAFEAVLTQVAGRGDREFTALKSNETLIYIAAEGLANPVAVEDQIVDGSVTWEIKDVEKVQPGVTPILYIATAEK